MTKPGRVRYVRDFTVLLYAGRCPHFKGWTSLRDHAELETVPSPKTLSGHAFTWEASNLLVAGRLPACLAKCGSRLRTQWHCKFNIKLKLNKGRGCCSVARYDHSSTMFPYIASIWHNQHWPAKHFELPSKATQANKW